MKRSEIVFGVLRIPMDFAMVVLGFLLGYHLRIKGDFIPNKQFELDLSTLPPLTEYTQLSFIFAALFLVVFGLAGLYRFKKLGGPLHEFRQVFSYSLVWVLVVMSYFFVVREVFFSRLALGFSVICSILLVSLARMLLYSLKRLLLRTGIGKRRVILIGKNKISDHLASFLEADPGYKLIGIVQNIHAFKRKIKKSKVDEIIQTSQELSELEDHDLLEYCLENHLDYRFIPDILEVERSNVDIQMLEGYPILHLKPTRLEGWGKVWKRLADLFASGLSLILLSPLFLLVAIGIKLDSKGPIIFCQLEDGSPANRIGQKGKPFQFYKFRTMQNNSHHLRESLKDKSHRKGPLMKIKDDPRITRFGRLLRRTSIDELPNLWNVFKGDMSLVGPRPHLPEEVEQYEKHHKFLLTIKPGITGLSQISGRSDLDFEEEVRLDSYYIKHWSLFLDFKILVRTVLVVFSGKAAD